MIFKFFSTYLRNQAERLDYPWETPSFFIFQSNLASFISIIYDLYQNIQQNEMYNNRCKRQRKEQTKRYHTLAYKNWFNQCLLLLQYKS